MRKKEMVAEKEKRELVMLKVAQDIMNKSLVLLQKAERDCMFAKFSGETKNCLRN